MIICYSKKFTFIRIPKTASTTASLLIYDSGVLDHTRDIVLGIEDGTVRHEPEGTARRPMNIPNSWDFKPIDIEKPNFKLHLNRIRHASFNSLVKKQFIKSDMTCYSTIRNPIDRFISIVYFNAKYGKENPIQAPEQVNEVWDKFCSGETVFDDADYLLRIPQYTFLNDEPILWNTENIHEHALEFGKKYDVSISKTIAKAKYSNERVRDWNLCLTKQRQEQVLEMYEKDFLLWENTYKKFN
jgi:hypothetical protein